MTGNARISVGAGSTSHHAQGSFAKQKFSAGAATGSAVHQGGSNTAAVNSSLSSSSGLKKQFIQKQDRRGSSTNLFSNNAQQNIWNT